MCGFKNFWLYLASALLLLLFIVCTSIHAPQIYDEMQAKMGVFVTKDKGGIDVYGEFDSKGDLAKTKNNLEMFFSPVSSKKATVKTSPKEGKWSMILQNIAYYFATNLERGKMSYINGKFSIEGDTLNPQVKDDILSALDFLSSHGIETSENIKIIQPKNAKQKVKKAIYELTNIKTIEFETGKATIKEHTYPLLISIIAMLKENPNLSLDIQGHTDSDGDRAFNQALSLDRANAIKSFFTQRGISEERLSAVGYGDSRPALPNTSAKNKQKNRRVEFKIKGE